MPQTCLSLNDDVEDDNDNSGIGNSNGGERNENKR